MTVLDVQAIVMAAGRGSRMNELVSSIPKCLLPIGNKPMIYYPIHMLELAKFSEVLVCVLENQERSIRESLAGLFANIKLDFFTIKEEEDLGTVDTLKSLHEKQKIKTDFLVISCDTLTNFPLIHLVNLFRVHDPTLAALVSRHDVIVDGSTPGKKGKPDLEKDLIGTDPEDKKRLVFFQSELEFDEDVPLRVGALRKCSKIDLSNNCLDAHVYILKRWVLNFLKDRKKFKSIKGDLIPYLIDKQFDTQPKKPNEPIKDGQEKTNLLDCVETESLIKILGKLDTLYLEKSPPIEVRKVYPDSLVKCIASIPKEDISIRCNTVTGYYEANKRLRAIYPDLSFDEKHDPPPPSNSSSTPGPPVRPQIGNDCIIAPSVKIGDRTSIKKSSIGSNCIIGEKVKITNSVIMDDVKIQDGCTVQGSIVCSKALIGANAEIKECVVTAGHEIVGVETPLKFSNEVLPSMATGF